MLAVANGYTEEQVAEAFTPSSLYLILLPTEKCNFRCTYCYEDFALGRMKPWLTGAITTFLQRRIARGLKFLHVSWFGGEPLLARKMVLALSRQWLQLSIEHDAEYSGSFTTNGYLLDPELVAQLSSVRSSTFQITLDGYGVEHDRTRRLANGGATFAAIWHRLMQMKSSDIAFDVQLRLHVSHEKVDSQRVLIQHLNEALGGDPRFHIHFHRISDLGRTPENVQLMSDSAYRAALADLQQGVSLRASSEVELIDQRYICYAAKPNSFLIRADGRLGKCTVALDDPRNDVGRIRPDGTLDVDNPAMRRWFEGFETFDSEMLGCPLSRLSQSQRPAREIPVAVTP